MAITGVTYVTLLIVFFIGGIIMLEAGVYGYGKAQGANDKTQSNINIGLMAGGSLLIVIGFIWQIYADPFVSASKTALSYAR